MKPDAATGAAAVLAQRTDSQLDDAPPNNRVLIPNSQLARSVVTNDNLQESAGERLARLRVAAPGS